MPWYGAKEVLGLKSVPFRGLLALLLISILLGVGGCMPRGGVINAGWTVVTVQDQVVYGVLAAGQVVALDAAKGGDVVWSYPPAQQGQTGPACSIIRPASGNTVSPLDAVYGLPVVSDGLLLVTSFDKHLYAFDRATGDKVWDYAVEQAIIGGVTLADGVAYFGSADHQVYAVDLASQKPVWAQPFKTENRVWGAPAMDAKHIYIGSMDHFVYAIDRQTGAQVWRHDVGSSVPGSITLANGLLLVGGVDKKLHALKADDGSELWASAELGGWVWGEALVQDGVVYFGSLDGRVHALAIADGASRWNAVEVDGAVRAGPVVHGTNLIVGTDKGRVYTIKMQDGSRDLITDKVVGGVLSRPAVDGDMIYVGSTTGSIYALDTTRRDPVAWIYPPATK